MIVARWMKPLTLLAMCLGLFMPQLDTTVVNLALPSIQKSLQSDVGALQWIIDSYNLTFACLLLTGGTLGDLFGRKRLFLVGGCIELLGGLLAMACIPHISARARQAASEEQAPVSTHV